MSKLEQLIKEHCHDGVAKMEIGEFAKAETEKNRDRKCTLAYSITKGGLVPTSEYFKDTKVTSDDTSGYRIVKKNWFVYSPSRIDVGSINYLREDITVIVSPLNVVFSVDESVIIPSYLLYFLNSRSGTWQILTSREGIEGTGRKLLPFDKFSKIKVPVPPIDIQLEIIKILDSISEYNATLEKELTARKKQYEYYRDLLLDFGVHGGRTSECEWRTLGEIGLVTKLAGFEFTNYVTYSDEGKKIALRGLNVKNGRLDLTDVKYIDKSDFSKLSRSKLFIDDMLFTYVGTIGQVALIDENDKYYLAPNVALIRINKDYLLPRFAMYFFQTNSFWSKQIDKLLQSSSMKNIPMEKIRKFKLPVPPIEEQERIVSILDRFDKLCNDISEGLPAEIEARRKQYEYYRDKLLSFEERG